MLLVFLLEITVCVADLGFQLADLMGKLLLTTKLGLSTFFVLVSEILEFFAVLIGQVSLGVCFNFLSQLLGETLSHFLGHLIADLSRNFLGYFLGGDRDGMILCILDQKLLQVILDRNFFVHFKWRHALTGYSLS